MNHVKEFKPTSWAINNKTSIFIFTIIVIVLGISTYNSLPKEQFPDIVIPTIFVSTVYPGTSPTDMENLITRHIEKQIKSISGIKKITSNSVQDFSSIVVEFNTGVDVSDAKQKVKDAVDKSKKDLPSDLSTYGDPVVQDINFSEIPMMNINLSGDFELDRLKKYADDLKDRIEELPSVLRVDEIGAPEHEIQIDMDQFRMDAAKVSQDDVFNAIRAENVIISGGQIPIGNMKRTIKVDGEFTNVDQIRNIIIQSSGGSNIYLKDVANVTYGYKEKDSYARLDGKNVITLNVIKRSGENLVATSDKTRAIVDDMQKTKFPSQLKVTITSDQSTMTRNTLTDLINSIIIGFILVVIILMFFMGTTNAIFVAMSVPLSVFIAFLVMPVIGFTLNMIVLFSLLFALGIVVDDAIVVIENTWRILNRTKMPVSWAAKYAAGEVFVPVLAGTLTTLSPFIPLAFWPGIIGQFMKYLPITLILTLLASLLVAYIINPVFAAQFMRPKPEPGKENGTRQRSKKSWYLTIGGFIFFALIFYGTKNFGMGNFTIFLLLLVFLNKYVFNRWIDRFQRTAIPRLQAGYARLISWALKGKRPYWMLAGTVVLFFVSIVGVALRQPQVALFPQGDPNFIYVNLKLPVGTNVRVTDSVAKTIEAKVFGIVGKNNPAVDAVIGNVGLGVGDDFGFGGGNVIPNQAKITVAFKEFKYRNGISTRKYMDSIRSAVKEIPGAEISVEQEQNGPPTGKPIDIEVSGDDFTQLISTTSKLKDYLDSLQIPGVEKLKIDADVSNPEILVNVDRERARRAGISTGQIGSAIRTAVYGTEVTKYREYEDEYPIMVRYDPSQRHNIDALMNLKITFRDNSGQLKQVPLSAVATVSYDNSLGGVTRKNLKRMITISSNVLSGYTPNTVNQYIASAIKDFPKPDGVSISQGGQSEDEQESFNFLFTALLISLCLIFLILVTQFNSFSKPMIILSEIIFSVIGVLLGIAIFKVSVSIIMTGIGIVGLAGIIVRNGILLVEFADELKKRGLRTREAIIQAGRTRMTPVLLTATATMLGLVPLALGININFATLFSEFNPHFYHGGDSQVFWGPLSWTIIFGLSFGTFLTLILVPCMYLIAYAMKVRLGRWRRKFFGPPTYPTHKQEVTDEMLETLV